MDSEIHPTLYSKYHQQIVYLKSSLKIGYPPLFIRKIWVVNTAGNDLINRAIETFV